MLRRPLLLALLLGLPAAALAQPFAAPFLAYSTGTEETSRYNLNVAAADFDGDGLPDLAIARNVYAGGFTFLRNTAAGTYAAPDHYGPVQSGGGPLPLPGNGLKGSFDVEAGDFDGDGDLDVVTTTAEVSHVGTRVSFYANDGTGTFSAAVVSEVGAGGPFELDAADFDGDGALDLAVTRYNVAGVGAGVDVMRGTGAGTFAAPTTFPLFDEPAEAYVETGDLDGDGDADVVVGTAADPRLVVLLNDGAGVFTRTATAAPTGTASAAQGLALADVDNDGDLDALTSAGYDHAINGGVLGVFFNSGSGVLTPTLEPLSDTPNSFIPNPWDLVVDDFDGDGWVDVVGTAYQYTIGGLIVLTGDGAGGFLPARRAPSVPTTVALAVTDYDVDGDPDVVTVDRLEFMAAVHPNRGGLDLFVPPAFSVPYATRVALGDLDGDGDPDAATTAEAQQGSVRTTLLLNDGLGAYTVSQTITSTGFLDARLRDLDGDAEADFVAGFGGRAVYAFSNGDGTVGDTALVDMAPCNQHGMVEALDLDADGDRDLVLNETFGCSSGPVQVWTALNDGTGTFAPAVASPIESSAPSSLPVGFDRFASGDFNEDGFLDLAFPDYTTTVVLGNGDGTFGAPIALADDERLDHVVAADLDGDGHLDLATAGGFGGFAGPSQAAVRFGDGAGGFSAPTFYDVGPGISGLTAGDADQDGDVDLLPSVGTANSVAFLENDGAGGFTLPLYVGVAWLFSGGTFADVTGDGLGDLVGLYSLPPGGGSTAFLVMVRGVDFRPTTASEPPAAPAPPTAALALAPARPNPATGLTRLDLTAAAAGRARVEAFDALGRRVAVLFDGPLAAGETRSVVFDGTALPVGVYVVRATSEAGTAVQRVTLVR